MRIFTNTWLCLALSLGVAQSQRMEPFGLEGKSITAIDFYANSIYAATENDGVFRRCLGESDSGWVSLGTPTSSPTSIFVFHSFCPLICWKGILVGGKISSGKDSSLIHFYQLQPDTCATPGEWIAADSGFDKVTILEINAFTGIDLCQPIGPTYVTAFAAAQASIWRSQNRGESWQLVWSTAATSTNILTLAALRTRITSTDDIWAGGVTIDSMGISQPLILYSPDAGESWQDRSPTSFALVECRALVLNPADTNEVYAAMRHSVIKSTDAGRSWNNTKLDNNDVVFNGIALNPRAPRHLLAGGTGLGDRAALFQSLDGGDNWQAIALPDSVAGISSVRFDSVVTEKFYVATLGSGLFRLSAPITAIEAEKPAPEGFYLHPSYPNPTRLSKDKLLTLRFSLPDAGVVNVRVFNVLGQEEASWRINLGSGEHSANFELNGTGLKPGIHFLRAEWKDQPQTRKWTVLR